MDNNYWNDVAKYGALLGILMGASKVLEQSMVLTGNTTYITLLALEALLSAVIFCVILIHAAKKQASKMDEKVGFSRSQSWGYMVIVSIFAAVPVTLLYYIYINSILGYDTYVAELIRVTSDMVSSQPIDSATADLLEMTFENLRTQPKPSIFSMLFGNIFTYAFAGGFVGLIFAGRAKRQPQIFSNTNE